MGTEWFVQNASGPPIGPLDSATLKTWADSGNLTPSTMVRKGEEGSWVPASKVKGLFQAAKPGDDRMAGGVQEGTSPESVQNGAPPSVPGLFEIGKSPAQPADEVVVGWEQGQPPRPAAVKPPPSSSMPNIGQGIYVAIVVVLFWALFMLVSPIQTEMAKGFARFFGVDGQGRHIYYKEQERTYSEKDDARQIEDMRGRFSPDRDGIERNRKMMER